MRALFSALLATVLLVAAPAIAQTVEPEGPPAEGDTPAVEPEEPGDAPAAEEPAAEEPAAEAEPAPEPAARPRPTSRTPAYLSEFGVVTADDGNIDDLLISLQHVMHFPGHWGLGVDAIFRVPHLLHVTFDLSYGLRLPPTSDDSIGLGSWSASLYAGFPLIEWVSSKGGNWAISQSRSGDTVTTKYFPVVVPAHDALVVEAGIMVLPYLTEISDPGDYIDDDYAFQLWTMAAGLRWHSHWEVDLKIDAPVRTPSPADPAHTTGRDRSQDSVPHRPRAIAESDHRRRRRG